jgi:hypothetical protein
MPAQRDPWRWGAAVLLALVGVWRLLQGLAMTGLPDAPLLGTLALLGQGLAAFAAALALLVPRPRLALAALVAFVACVALQMGADAFVYGIRSVLEAAAAVLAAGALAVAAWLALRPRAPTVRTL